MLKYILFLFFMILFVFSKEEDVDKNVLKLDLKNFLNEVVKNYKKLKIKSLDEVNSVADYQEYFYSNNSPYISFDYTNSSSYIKNLSPMSSDNDDYTKRNVDTIDLSLNQPISYTGSQFKIGYKHDINRASDIDLTGVRPGDESFDTKGGSVYIGFNQSVLRGGPIFLPGFKRMDALKENVRLKRSEYNKELEDLVVEAIGLYYDYIVVQNQIKTTEASLKDAQRIYRQNARKMKYGAIQKYDFYDSEIFLKTTGIELKSSNLLLESLKNKIYLYLGKSKNINITLEGGIEEIEDENYDKSLSTENALAFNSDLKEARSRARSSFLALKMAKAEYLPKLDLFFNIAWKGEREKGSSKELITDNGNPNFSVGFNLTSPILPQSYKIITKKAKTNSQKTQLNVSLLEEGIKLNIDYQIETLKRLKSDSGELNSIFQLRKRSLKEKERKFNNAKMDFDTYVNYYRKVRESEIQYLRKVKEFQVEYSKFLKFQGSLLKTYDINEKVLNEKITLTP